MIGIATESGLLLPANERSAGRYFVQRPVQRTESQTAYPPETLIELLHSPGIAMRWQADVVPNTIGTQRHRKHELFSSIPPSLTERAGNWKYGSLRRRVTAGDLLSMELLFVALLAIGQRVLCFPSQYTDQRWPLLGPPEFRVDLAL